MNIEAIKSGKLKQLPGANLEDEELSQLDLSRINLAGATLVGTNFASFQTRRWAFRGSESDGGEPPRN